MLLLRQLPLQKSPPASLRSQPSPSMKSLRMRSRFATRLGGLGGAQSLGGGRVDEPGGLPGRNSVQHLVHEHRPSERSPD